MIKSDLGITELEGNAPTLLAELTYAVHHATRAIAEKLEISIEEVDADLLDAVRIIRLADSGMDIHEAHKIIKGDNEI